MIYFKRFFSLFLCFILFLYICTNVYIYSYAGNIDKNLFDKIYEGYDFSDTIAKHGSFSFLDKANNKHSVYYGNGTWVCLFGRKETFNDDSALNYYLSYYAYKGYSEVSNLFGAYLSNKIGYASKEYTALENAMASDITNVANNISYDVNNDTITFDSSSVDKLREDIKQYYYNSIGIVQYEASGSFSDYINGRYFSHLFEYDEDYGEALSKVKNYKYALADSYINGNVNTSEHAYLWDSSSYIYLSDIKGFAGTSSYGNVVYRLNIYIDGASSNLTDNLTYYYYYGIDNNSYSTFKDNIYGLYIDPNGSYYNKIYPCISDKTESFKPYFNYIDAYPCFRYTDFKFYSYDGEPLRFFKSYSAMYNFINGDQNAYLSSTIEKTGEDITFSIKDMNENLGNKMDALIDSINSNKSNMSADELQNAIDKGLEDLNKNTEDIKDNTSDILDTLKEQNNILLQILGVTEYIAYQNDKYNNTYTKADMSNLFKKSFNRVSDAVLYGEKVDDDNEETIDRTKFSYHNGIFGHFPFSVPYQLYEWLKVLQSEPMCPEFTYHYGFLIGISKDSDEYDKYKITFNLSAYDSWREVAASFLKLAFTLTMAIGTYKKFKGEL